MTSASDSRAQLRLSAANGATDSFLLHDATTAAAAAAADYSPVVYPRIVAAAAARTDDADVRSSLLDELAYGLDEGTHEYDVHLHTVSPPELPDSLQSPESPQSPKSLEPNSKVLEAVPVDVLIEAKASDLPPEQEMEVHNTSNPKP
jgi:hypothetical protein